MAYFRFFVALILAAVLGWVGLGSFHGGSLFGPRIAAPSPFNTEGLPPEARSEVGGNALYRADAVRGVIDTRDPSIRIGS